MAETWLDDVIAPSLLQGMDVNKPVPPQFDIGWEELLGQVLKVRVILNKVTKSLALAKPIRRYRTFFKQESSLAFRH